MSDVMFLFKIQGEFILRDYTLLDVENGEVKKEEFDSNKGSFGNTPEAKEAPSVNDNLKGLSAAQNSDIYRIIRDHERGKLNIAIATARLAAYGIDSDTIENILKQD
jgi:hypothetical protein